MMNRGMNINKTCGFNFVLRRALVNRLDPGIIPFREATECQIHGNSDDGYAIGFFHELLNGVSSEESVQPDRAHGALLTTFPGDSTRILQKQVKNLCCR